MEKNLTRGEFLKKMFGFAAEQVSKAVERRLESVLPDRPRPPWSLKETGFIVTCEKCRSCGDICPKGVIYHYKNSAGVVAGTPFLDFSRDFCDYCGECVKACPSGALSFLNEGKQIGVAQISAGACVALSGTICRSCEESCPETAISLNPTKYPVIDEEKCNGCGACVPQCIGNAIGIKKS